MDMNHPALLLPKAVKGTATKQRRAKSRKRAAAELVVMNKVRVDRVTCHIPECPCTAKGVAPEVGHRRHRGMGGNPAGDRTVPADLFLLCPWRHQGPTVSLHMGTLRMVGDGASAVPMVRMDAVPWPVVGALVVSWVDEGVSWVAVCPIVSRWLAMEWKWIPQARV